MTNEYTAAAAVVKAWTEEGSHPHYHRASIRSLRENWPTLYHAIAELVATMAADDEAMTDTPFHYRVEEPRFSKTTRRQHIYLRRKKDEPDARWEIFRTDDADDPHLEGTPSSSIRSMRATNPHYDFAVSVITTVSSTVTRMTTEVLPL